MHQLQTQHKVVGTKQTLKALQKGEIIQVYIAKDAQEHVTKKIKEFAKEQNIPTIYMDTMKELAALCDVEVQTATAAILKNDKEV